MFSDGDGYQLLMGRWSRELAPLFVTFAKVDEGCTGLDVGCGTGELTCAAAEIGSINAIGVDRSAAYIRAAQQRAGGRSVRFEVGDAQALPFADDTFDRTLSMLVLNFVAEPAVALREMIRVTRNNGVVAAAVWDYGDGMGMLHTFWNEAAHAAVPGRRARGTLADRGAAGRPGNVVDHRNGIQLFRRLLAVV